MNYYHVWADLREGHNDLEFSDAVTKYLGHLKERGLIEGFRITRRKFGFGPSELGDFHIVMELRDLAQLDAAFNLVATRSGEIETLHRAVYGAVTDLRSALYRDFPDPVRMKRGG